MVHGDPMFKVNGSGMHFWLAPGQLSPLLSWKSPDRSGSRLTSMQLLGRTFDSPDSRNQWFDQFVITQDGATVLDVAVKERIGSTRQLSGTMDVKVDGKAADHVPSALLQQRTAQLFSSSRAAVQATMSKRHDGVGDNLETRAGGLALAIYSSKAEKFDRRTMAKSYMHLNLKFDDGFPEGASGIFSEMAGQQKLSQATKALLKAPSDAIMLLTLDHPCSPGV